MLGPLLAYSQSEREHIFLQPQIFLTKALHTNYDFNLSMSHRAERNPDNAKFQDYFFEISHVSSLKVGVGKKLNLGVLGRRYSAKTTEVRFSQHFVISSGGNPRIIHRLGLEQRLFPDETRFRIRYRLGFDSPLNGMNVDPGEPYFLGNIESLSTLVANQKTKFEQRISLGLGHFVNARLRYQGVFQLRLKDMGQNSEEQLFGVIGVYVKL